MQNVLSLAPDAVGHHFAQFTRSLCKSLYNLAGQGEFWRPAVGESSPVCLITFVTSIASTLWLPRLVERLEVEDVHSPGERCADTRLEELLLVCSAGMSLAIIGSNYDKLAMTLLRDDLAMSRTISRPSSLAVPYLNSVETDNALNMTDGLLKIIEVSRGGVVDVLVLPVPKCVYHPSAISKTQHLSGVQE